MKNLKNETTPEAIELQKQFVRHLANALSQLPGTVSMTDKTWLTGIHLRAQVKLLRLTSK
jgi:hypothetical protein